MGLDVRFARGADGKPAASSPPPIEAVGAFFERDIGPDPGFGDEVLEMIDDIASGRESAAQQLSAGPPRGSSVTIDDTYPEQPVRLTAEVGCDVGGCGELYQDTRRDRHGAFVLCVVDGLDFRAALVAWLAFVRGGSAEAEPGAAADTGGVTGSRDS